jgi:hypothetical protein
VSSGRFDPLIATLTPVSAVWSTVAVWSVTFVIEVAEGFTVIVAEAVNPAQSVAVMV